jgi:hypothetical protein
MASKQGNWVVRCAVLHHSCPSSAFIYLLALRSDTLFLSFFVQKVVAALQEAIVLVGKKKPN